MNFYKFTRTNEKDISETRFHVSRVKIHKARETMMTGRYVRFLIIRFRRER